MRPNTVQPETKSAPPKPRQAHPVSAAMLTLFVGISAVTIANQLGHCWPVQPWLKAAFVISALLASIATFAPTLAWPNVLLAAGLAWAIAGMAHAINAVTGFPFGQLDFTADAGPRPFGLVPWWLPAVWAAIALTARGTARLSLHRSRQHPQHGYHVIALATVLATFATLGLDTFARHSAHLWQPDAMHPLPASGHLLHLLIQIAITPLLIDKFPSPSPPNFRPLLVWVSMNAWPMLALWQANHRIASAVLAFGICAVIVAAFFPSRAHPGLDTPRLN